MKSSGWWVSLVVLTLILLAGLGYWSWGRRVIYPQESGRSEYSGQGKSTEPIFAHLVVSPKAEGEPFIANIGDGANYPTSEYDVASVPAQEGVNYVVGGVQGWEEITGSGDYYLLIEETPRSAPERYRIGLESSTLFNPARPSGTLLLVENTSLWQGGKNKIEKYVNPEVSELGYQSLQKIVRQGDSVVLIPVFAPPEYAKKDGNGNYLVLSLIVRRAGGAQALEWEMVGSEGKE